MGAFDEEYNKPHSLVKIASFTTLILALGIFGVALFWLVYPYEVASVNTPIKILNENHEIPVGGTILLEIEVNKPNDLRPDGSIFLACEDQIFTLVSNPTNIPVGKFTVVNDAHSVPETAQPGSVCTFNFRNEYQVNPIRVEQREWASEEFTVIEAADNG